MNSNPTAARTSGESILSASAVHQAADVQGALQVVEAQSVSPQAWRNGGGQTRELLAWPVGGDWRLRISRADIETDGPFSAFAGVERWCAVLQGAGVVLTFEDAEHTLHPGAAPLCFAGAAAPGCRLLDGPTQDLNLMLRQGTGVMRQTQTGLGWREAWAMRGLYTTVAGCWHGGGQMREMVAHSLLWVQLADAGSWTFIPHSPHSQGLASAAWWLGFTPGE